MLEQIHRYLERAVKDRVFPGCVLGIYASGAVHIIARGHYTYDKDSVVMHRDAVFDCASITKVIPTSSLALMLLDRGKLSLSDRMIEFIPEYSGNYRDHILIHHLLTHTVDFDLRLSSKKSLPAEDVLCAVFSSNLNSFPGEKFCYANATSILLGLVVERILGKSLEHAAQEEIFTPLGMETTTFYPEEMDKSMIVPTEEDDWRGRVIQGELHDESAWALRPIMTAGSAGLFSTAGDLLKFCAMLINGGCSEGRRFFSEEIVSAIQTDQLSGIKGATTGLGWELNQDYMGLLRSSATFGKTGFTGTVLVCDRGMQVAFVLLSNHIWPKRRGDRREINRVRSDISDMVYALL